MKHIFSFVFLFSMVSGSVSQSLNSLQKEEEQINRLFLQNPGLFNGQILDDPAQINRQFLRDSEQINRLLMNNPEQLNRSILQNPELINRQILNNPELLNRLILQDPKQLNRLHPSFPASFTQAAVNSYAVKKQAKNTPPENEYGDPPGFQWVKPFDRFGSTMINSLAQGESGDIFYCGHFSGKTSIGDKTYESQGFFDGFIARADLSGDQVWARLIQGGKKGTTICTDIITDAHDNVYVTGYFESDTLWAGDQRIEKAGLNDLFLAKYDAGGNVLFLSGYGADSVTVMPGEMHADTEGNLYILDSNLKTIFKFSADGSFSDLFQPDCNSLVDFVIADNKLYLTGTGHHTMSSEGPYILVVDNQFNEISFSGYNTDAESIMSSITYDPVRKVFYLGGITYSSIDFDSFIVSKMASSSYNYFLLSWTVQQGAISYIAPELFLSEESQKSGYHRLHDIWVMPDGKITGMFHHYSSFPFNTDTFIDGIGYTLGIWDSDLSPITWHEFREPLSAVLPLAIDTVLYSIHQSGSCKAEILDFRGESKELFALDPGYGMSRTIGICADKQDNIYLLGYSSAENSIASGKKGLFVNKLDTTGMVSWSKNFAGAEDMGSADENSISLDNRGNIYFIGKLTGSMVVGAELWENEGDADPLIFKISTDGELQWIRRIETTETEISLSAISVDSSGNLIITGDYESGGIQYGDLQIPEGIESDLFILKLSPEGEGIWLKQFGGEKNEYWGHSVTNRQDEIYYAAVIRSNNILLDGQEYSLTEEEGIILLIKLDSDGNMLWVKNYGAGPDKNRENCFVFSIAMNGDEDLFISGWMGRENTFGDTVLIGGNYLNPYSMRLDKEGNVKWANNIKTTQYYFVWTSNIVFDDEGSCYLGGAFEYELNINGHVITSSKEGSINLFLVKYDENGNLEWVKQETCLSPDLYESIGLLNSLCLLKEDKIIAGGVLTYGMQFDDVEITGYNNQYGFIGFISREQVNTYHPEIRKQTSDLFIYPNPASEFLHCKLPSGNGRKYTLEVFSMSGVRLISENRPGGGDTCLDISHLEKGPYILIVGGEDSRLQQKFIIQ